MTWFAHVGLSCQLFLFLEPYNLKTLMVNIRLLQSKQEGRLTSFAHMGFMPLPKGLSHLYSLL